MEISKELLSQVLAVDIRKINGYILDGNLYYYKAFVKCKSKINIYELANKCKEWAYSQGYILFSKIRLSSSLASCYFDVMGKHDYEDSYHNDFRAETESEAIFKACQWILDRRTKD